MSRQPTGFLGRIHQRIAEGLRDLPAEQRGRHTAFLLSRQQADGGFAGRAGAADLYYTGFAATGLSLLGATGGETAARCVEFLRKNPPANVVDQLQWLLAAAHLSAPPVAAKEVAQLVESFRSADGGYGKKPAAAGGSTYWSYLAALCYDLLGERPPGRGRLRAFLRTRRCDEGGFSETGRVAAGTTNATTAGIGLAVLSGWAGLPMAASALGWLAKMQSPLGGFVAGPRVPVPDLLSTFTASVTLIEARATDRFDAKRAAAFAASCADPAGGFRAAPWDDAADVEYTYYGLGCRGLMGPAAGRGRPG